MSIKRYGTPTKPGALLFLQSRRSGRLVAVSGQVPATPTAKSSPATSPYRPASPRNPQKVLRIRRILPS